MLERISYLKGAPDVREMYYLGDPVNREFGLVVLQPGRPVEAGELNLLQQATNSTLRKLVTSMVGHVATLGPISPAATGQPDEITLHTPGQPVFIAVEGIIKTLAAFDQGASPTRGGNRITLPPHTTPGRQDLVYIEMWFEEVQATTSSGTASTLIYEYGVVQPNFILDNDIRIPAMDYTETTRRVQLRAQFGVLEGVTDIDDIMTLDPRGNEDYAYVKVGSSPLYRAGDGDKDSGEDLNTVDGVVYAVPLLMVTRGADATTMTFDATLPASLNLPDLSLGTEGDIAALASRVTNVENALGGKANITHTHNASDINAGTLSVARGGTGTGTFTANSFLVGNGTSAIQTRTPAQVLGDIGAAPAVHSHTFANITGRAANTQLPTGTDGWVLTAKGSSSNPVYQALSWSNIADKPGSFPPEAHTHPNATYTTAGFMSGADKIKLDGVPVGSYASPGVWGVSSAGNNIGLLTTGTNERVLRRHNDSVGFGQVTSGAIENGAVTDAKIGSMNASKLTGSIALARINDGLITRAKLSNGSALSVIGRSANSTGAVADISAGTDGHVLRRSGNTLGFGTIGNSSISGLDASKLSGTVARARLPVGSTNNTQVAPGQDMTGSGNARHPVGSVRLVAIEVSDVTAGTAYFSPRGVRLSAMGISGHPNPALSAEATSAVLPGSWQALNDGGILMSGGNYSFALAVRVS